MSTPLTVSFEVSCFGDERAYSSGLSWASMILSLMIGRFFFLGAGVGTGIASDELNIIDYFPYVELTS